MIRKSWQFGLSAFSRLVFRGKCQPSSFFRTATDRMLRGILYIQFLRTTAYNAIATSEYVLRTAIPPVCPSVTRVDFIKTAEHVEILSLVGPSF